VRAAERVVPFRDGVAFRVGAASLQEPWRGVLLVLPVSARAVFPDSRGVVPPSAGPVVVHREVVLQEPEERPSSSSVRALLLSCAAEPVFLPGPPY
jgi:hypothetical protein